MMIVSTVVACRAALEYMIRPTVGGTGPDGVMVTRDRRNWRVVGPILEKI